ncbi:MAG: hypothetical protein ACXV8G_03110 [Acidimicrobiales bacterium]
MTRGTRATSTKARVAWIGIALLVLGGLTLQVDALIVHRRADRADELTRAARQQAADTDTAVEAAHGDLDQAVTQAMAASPALEAVRAVLVAAGTSESSIAGDVVAARAAMASLQTQIDASAAGVQTRSAQLVALRGCLDVGQRALDAAAVRKGDGVDADLTAASVACAGTATSAVGP